MRFALVTLGITALVGLGIVAGAPWAGLAVLAITVLAFFLDRLAVLDAPDRPDAEFPAGHGLSVVLGLAHFPVLFGGVWALSAARHDALDTGLIFFAVALFCGQIGNANAHELIHRPGRAPRRLGAAVYASLLFGHHASAHLRVHHVRAATPEDPSTARLGESYYAFAWRAWSGAFREGWRAERRLQRRGRIHPYAGHAAVSAASAAGAWAIGGAAGLGWFAAIALYAQAQLLLSDYVQHYGLERHRRPDGRWAPIGPEHSWNAGHGYSSAMMLNAPRHSDHHARPDRPFPELALDRAVMPMLPHSLPVMAVIALVPPIWRRVMDRRALRVRAALAPS